ncbi:MAG: hypothetical protein JJ863_19590 [Deltaproteobacteria bacterium]|nr:hypothetical protein [Deltaproteobacteria bacterium]
MISLEAIGIPGAGKSTVVSAAVHQLAESGIAAWDRAAHQRAIAGLHAARGGRLARARALALFAGERHDLVRSIVRLTLRTRPPLPVSWVRAWNLWRMAHNEHLLREEGTPPAVVLHDQSLLQEIWSVLYLRPCSDEDALRGVLEALVEWLPDIVFLPRVDGDVALARMAERRGRVGVTTDLDRMNLRAEDMERTQDEAIRIAEMAADVAGARLVVTNGSVDPTLQVRAILAAIDARGGEVALQSVGRGTKRDDSLAG